MSWLYLLFAVQALNNTLLQFDETAITNTYQLRVEKKNFPQV